MSFIVYLSLCRSRIRSLYLGICALGTPASIHTYMCALYNLITFLLHENKREMCLRKSGERHKNKRVESVRNNGHSMTAYLRF